MANWAALSVGGRRAMRAVATAITGCAAALCISAAAQAAPTWLAPVQVGPTTTTSCLSFILYTCDADIAVAPDGTAFLAMVHFDPDQANRRRASVSVRPPGGSFGAPQYLSPADRDVSGSDGRQIDVAVDRQGNATVVWGYIQPGPARSIVQASYRPVGEGAFRPAETLSNTAHSADMPTVAVSDNGGAVAVWRNNNAGTFTVQRAFRAAGAANFGSLSDISTSSTNVTHPKVVMTPAGNAVAVWEQDDRIWEISRPAGEDFDAAQREQISGTSASQPDVAIAPDGQATAVWMLGPGGSEVIQARERRIVPNFKTGTWAGTDVLTEAGEFGSAPAVAVDASNRAVAVWSGNQGGSRRVRAATRVSGGSFAERQSISAPGTLTLAPQVSIAPNGDAVATWSFGEGFDEAVQSARRPAGQVFGAVDTLVQGTSGGTTRTGVWFRPPPRVAFDSESNGFATWIGYTTPLTTYSPSNYVQVAGLDAAPPSFTGISVPATGIIGQPVGMSAGAVDRLGATGISWSFGDGGTGSGGSVAHTYNAPGVYTVTVGATDGVGNGTSQTRTIQISPPPRPPRVTFKLSSKAKAFRRFTRLTRIQVKGLSPRGSTVRAVCAFKRKKCPGKARKAFTKRNAGGTVSLNKRYRGPRLKVGTTITVRVTKRGYIGAAKILKIRKGKRPQVTNRCMLPGSTRLRRSC